MASTGAFPYSFNISPVGREIAKGYLYQRKEKEERQLLAIIKLNNGL
jgi:hypothetical protein